MSLERPAFAVAYCKAARLSICFVHLFCSPMPSTARLARLIRRSGKPEFTNAEVYVFARKLEELHPDNPVNNTGQVRHVRDNPVNTRGRNPPAIAGLARAGLLRHAAPGLWRLS
jgi:hypothetical protein